MWDSISPKFPMHSFFCPRWAGMSVGLLWAGWIGTVYATEEADKKIARLGFNFDQHAHDLAVAADETNIFSDKNEFAVSPEGVILLPKYTVNEKRMPFTERDILTPEGRITLANKRYISPVYRKTLGPLAAIASLLMNPLGGWRPNDREAMTLYNDAEQKRRNSAMRELFELEALREPPAETQHAETPSK